MKRVKQPWLMKKVRDNQRENREVEKGVTDWVSVMNLSGASVIVPENNSLALRFNKYINKRFKEHVEESIRNDPHTDRIVGAINRRLCEIGYMNFLQVSEYTRPDHVLSPEALAFAIFSKHLNEEQIIKVELLLDHGETLKDFIASGVHLPLIVIQQLAKPRRKHVPHKWPNDFIDGECFESH